MSFERYGFDTASKLQNLDNVPASVDFSRDISYPPKSDSRKLHLKHPVVIKPHKGFSVGYDRFGRRDFEFTFQELPDKDFSRWGMTLGIKYDDAGDSLDITRFGITINLPIDETAYLKLQPHSRYGIAMDKSNTVAVLSRLPKKAFAKVQKDGLSVYQLTRPGGHFVLDQEKIILPGSVVLNNAELSGYNCVPRPDLRGDQLYEADDRFFALMPDPLDRAIEAMNEGRIDPQPVIFTNF